MAKLSDLLSKETRKRMLYFYIAFLLLLSISVTLMPFAFRFSNRNLILTYISGTIFWIGLIGTIIVAIYITYSRKHSKEFKAECLNHKQLGLIHFFQNLPAKICDISLFISLICFLIVCIWFDETVFPFVFLSVLIFSFGMHCMLNGSNYLYINYEKRSEKES